MNKKQNIQIAVIIVAFGASGFVLYNGFFKGSGQASTPTSPIQNPIMAGTSSIPASVPASPGPSGANSQTILPAGGQLDFNLLQSQNLSPQNVSYPQLSTSSDVGISEQNLITPDLSAGK